MSHFIKNFINCYSILIAILISGIHFIPETNTLFAQDTPDNLKFNEYGDSSKVYVAPAITITSTRAKLGESPLPFSELNKEDITNKYITSDMPKLLSVMPSIIFSSQNGNGIGYSDIKMRGFDQRRIAVMVNGIPQNDPEDHEVYWIDMPDLAGSTENIQVQRGAGLANYGSPSIGGSINIITSTFANRKGLRVFGGIGTQYFGANTSNSINSNVSKLSLEYASGLVDKSAFYAKVSRINSDGYRDNSWAKLQSYYFSYSYFGDKLLTQVNFFGGPVADGSAYTGLPKAYIKDNVLRRKNYSWGWTYDSTGQNLNYFAERSKHEVEEFNQPHFEILNNYKINNNLIINSSLFYYRGAGYFDGDYSWADYAFNDIAKDKYKITEENKFKNPFTRAWVINNQFGWIPKITYLSQYNELTAGIEIRRHQSDHNMNIIFAEQLPKDYDLDYDLYFYNGYRDILSFFIKDNFKINEKFSIFGDIQVVNHSFRIGNETFGGNPVSYYNENSEKVGENNILFDINYVFFNPRLGVNYKLNKNINFYAFAAQTSREPRMKNLYHASESLFGATPNFEYDIIKINDKDTYIYNFAKPNAKPEKMLDIEFGGNYISENYNLSANFYYMDYTDEYVKTGKKDKFGTTLDENAAKSLHYGVELTASANIINKNNFLLNLWANMTYSQNLLKEYDVYFYDKTGTQNKISLKDNEIAGFPNFMSNLGLNAIYKDFFVGITGKYVGDFYTDNYGEMLRTNTLLINSLALKDDYYFDNINDAYFVCDLDLSYTFKQVLTLNSIKLQLQINNLFNSLYSFSGDGKEFFPAAERSVFFGVELGL
mgnify:CR=1 FL=1